MQMAMLFYGLVMVSGRSTMRKVSKALKHLKSIKLSFLVLLVGWSTVNPSLNT